MNCEKFELLIMQHFEQTIEPASAAELTKHVLRCENCRELYLMMDEATDETSEDILAPVNFTASVMDKVRELPVYQKPETQKIKESGMFTLRILWGFSAIIFGVGVLFMFNPDLLTALAGSYPIVYSIVDFITAVGMAVGGVMEWLSMAFAPAGAANELGVIALLFVAVMGVLLFALNNSGHSVNAKGKKSVEA